MPTTIDLAALAPEDGFAVQGASGAAAAGDFNGDGIDDLVFNANGSANVIFGQAGPRGTLDLDDPGVAGTIIEVWGLLASAGDVNGDGFDDLVIGTPGAGAVDSYGGSMGGAYVVYGGADLDVVDLTEVTPDEGIEIPGEMVIIGGTDYAAQVGSSVASAGDVDNDGFADVLIGQKYEEGQNGSGVHLYEGASGGPHVGEHFLGRGLTVLPAGDLNGDGYSDVIDRERNASGEYVTTIYLGGPTGVSDNSGSSFVRVREVDQVVGIGDLNGDGFDDFAAMYAGTGYVFFGASSLPAPIRLRDAGFAVGSGVLSFSGLGDVNGDGFEDLAVRTADGWRVLFGQAEPFADITDPDAFGLAFDSSVTSLVAAGDVNGDGIGDMLASSGSSRYVVYGSTAFVPSSGNDTIEGDAGANALSGGGGDDTLSGYGGDDTLDGGSGDDTLYGHDGNDTLDGGAGADRLYGGLLDDVLTGGDGNDVLNGQAGNDALGGGAGDDTMRGGAGNDSYRVGSAGDQVIEAAGEGTDRITAEIDWTLSDNVEILTLVGGARAGNGNALANTLFGSGGADTLAGLAGDDTLRGREGRDVLLGGEGADLLDGGLGKDTLTGGAGRDVFQFRDGDFGATRALADAITDFSKADKEKISLNLVDADTTVAGNQAFAWLGNGAFTHVAGQLHYAQAGGNTYVEGDLNGDGTADFVIALTGLVNLTAGDFVL